MNEVKEETAPSHSDITATKDSQVEAGPPERIWVHGNDSPCRKGDGPDQCCGNTFEYIRADLSRTSEQQEEKSPPLAVNLLERIRQRITSDYRTVPQPERGQMMADLHMLLREVDAYQTSEVSDVEKVRGMLYAEVGPVGDKG